MNLTVRYVVLLCGLALLNAGCGTVKRFGDATVYDRWNFPFVAVDEFRLPKMKLDGPRSYDFKVRNLPFAIYPTALRMAVRSDEMDVRDRSDQPWRPCELKIELRSLTGETFYSNTIRLAEKTNRWWDESSRLRIRLEFLPRGSFPFQFGEITRDTTFALPLYTSYDVHVEVLRPPRNSFYRAQLFTEQLIFY